jgi:hypothetical protein
VNNSKQLQLFTMIPELFRRLTVTAQAIQETQPQTFGREFAPPPAAEPNFRSVRSGPRSEHDMRAL